MRLLEKMDAKDVNGLLHAILEDWQRWQAFWVEWYRWPVTRITGSDSDLTWAWIWQGKVHIRPVHTAWGYLGFFCIKWLVRIFLCPSRGDAGPSQEYSPALNYILEWREALWEKTLSTWSRVQHVLPQASMLPRP